MIYFIPVMIHGWVEDLQADRTHIITYTTMEAEDDGWDPVKLA